MRRLPRARWLGWLCAATAAAAPPGPLLPTAPEPPGLLEDAHSVRVLRRDEPLYLRPEPGAPRRGSARLGARLGLYGSGSGPRCRGPWLLVGPSAWLCSDHVQLLAAPAPRHSDAEAPHPEGLPLDYYYVTRDGSVAYERLATAGDAVPVSQLQPGFAIGVVQQATHPTHGAFGLTTKDLWIPMEDLRRVRAPSLRGAHLSGSTQGLAWVTTANAAVYQRPGGPRSRDASYALFQQVQVVEERRHERRDWVRLADGRWLLREALSIHRLLAPPGLAPPGFALPGERWLDVDRQEQVLTAYQGSTPVFATLISTGKGEPGTELETPPGTFRVWAKLATTDMTNLEDEGAGRFYAIEEVPWVLYFQAGYGLHGAFWHHSFGHVRSHGCVNLSPADAEWLFHWTSPRLPSGWTAVLPTDYDLGTIVHVR